MKSILRIACVALLFAMVSNECPAERTVGIITKTKAGEMGLELRATPSGPDAAWLELEFKPVDRLKDYSHVELEIIEGEKPLIAYLALNEQRTEKGTVKLRFMARRDFLDKLTLVVVTGFPSNYANNELRVKDFVDAENIR